MAHQPNPLEQALLAAATNPASRPDFYHLLLASEVLVIGGTVEGGEGRRVLDTGAKVSIENWTRQDGSPVIPFFTSLDALQRAIEKPGSYLALPARALFEITRGAALVLNPNLDYGKEFSPDEVAALLTAGVTQTAEQRVVQQETKVLLGQPKNYPQQMVNALSAFLRQRSQVKAAYVLLMHDPSKDEKPHLVVGVHADGDIERLFPEIGTVAGDSAPAGETVDLFRVVPGDKGLSEYFVSSVRPFYQRTWSAQLKGLFG